MRKKYLLIMSMVLMTLFICVGCASVAKEKDIKEDLENFTEKGFLKKGEKIDKVVIEKRETDKEQKEDIVWCVVTTQDSKISSEKKVVLSYHKYEKKEWTLDKVEVEDSEEWEITPLKGITKQDIPETLDGMSVEVDGESWEISESEVDEVSIDKQETELKEKTDKVTMTVMLNGKVEKAKGKLVIRYKFDDEWELDEILERNDFIAEVIPEKELNVGEDELIEELVQEKISYGDDSSMKQEIAIAKEEVSDFKIEKQESKVKGTEQSVYCSCTLNKANVELELQMIFFYSYNEKWDFSRVDVVTVDTKSLDILGQWAGEYSAAGEEGKVVLDITKVEGDEIVATYSYTPTNYRQAGSYSVAGKIDTKTLNMKLTAGDWIEKPDKDAFIKQDISAVINLDMGIIEGKGHHGYVFRAEKQ